MINICKNYYSKVLCTFRVCDEELVLSNDSMEMSTTFIPIAKAISEELAKLKIPHTFSYNDTKGYVNLQAYNSPKECIKYKFDQDGRLLSVSSKTFYATVEEEYEEE